MDITAAQFPEISENCAAFLQSHNDYLLIIRSGTGDCQSFFDDNSTF